MYDFYLGKKPMNLEEELRYLISIKRLFPRWINSIPDSEFSAIATILHNLGNEAEKNKEKLCLIETGVGASSLALVFYAMKHNGMAFTWDFNSKKGSEIRIACVETICATFDININKVWKLINYNSLSPYLGIGILKEWTNIVHFSMHDSEHVWNNIKGEINLVQPFLKDESIIAVDDAYYQFLHTDLAYINLIRKKFNLKTISSIEQNECDSHFVEAENLLKRYWKNVQLVTTEYIKSCRDDLSIDYFGNELKVRTSLGMEEVKKIENRFGAWKVSSRLN